MAQEQWKVIPGNDDVSLKDALDELFLQSERPETDSADEEFDTPTLIINLEEVNTAAAKEAEQITERLSNYYFDEEYIKHHPYIPNKISQEMQSIRRLLKMLTVNEKAQDALISNITSNAGKGSLYQSLTSLQNTTLSIQNQLNTITTSLEDIFRQMQEECEKSWQDKEKEESEEGRSVVRGSRDFIRSLLNEGYSQNKPVTEEENNEELEETPIKNIIGN